MVDRNIIASPATMANILRHHGLYDAVGLASRLARLLELAKLEGLTGADLIDADRALEEARSAGFLTGHTVADQKPETHDYGPGKRRWGHDYTIMAVHDGGKRLRLSGWGCGIRANDFLLLDNRGDPTRYKVETIEYMINPRDQWFAEATFAPRMEGSANS